MKLINFDSLSNESKDHIPGETSESKKPPAAAEGF